MKKPAAKLFLQKKQVTYVIMPCTRQLIGKPSSLGWLHVTAHSFTVNHLI